MHEGLGRRPHAAEETFPIARSRLRACELMGRDVGSVKPEAPRLGRLLACDEPHDGVGALARIPQDGGREPMEQGHGKSHCTGVYPARVHGCARNVGPALGENLGENDLGALGIRVDGVSLVASITG